MVRGYRPLSAFVLAVILATVSSAVSTAVSAEGRVRDRYRAVTLFELGKAVSSELGYTVLYSPRVKLNSEVDIYTSQRLNKEELYTAFLSVLRVNGYIGVRDGNVIRVVRSRQARSMSADVLIPDGDS